MNGKVFAIVQARLGSKRFPRKMFSKIGNYSLLTWVLRRLKKCSLLDGIILATSSKEHDYELVREALSENLYTFIGSEKNVYERFVRAANFYKVRTIIRVCGDNPFVDPEEVDKLVSFFKNNSYDYVCNHMNKMNNLYADGFGAEILTTKTLESFAENDLTSSQKEHVTSYIWDNQNNFKVCAIKAPKYLAFPEFRFDINEEKDLEYINKIVSNGVNIHSNAKEIMNVAISLK
mgnify:FL=1